MKSLIWYLIDAALLAGAIGFALWIIAQGLGVAS